MAVNQPTSSIVATSIVTIIKGTNRIATIANLTIAIKTIGATTIFVAIIRNQRAASPSKIRMIASRITLRKKSDKAMHNDQSSLSSKGNSSRRRSRSCPRSPLHSCSWSHSCSSSKSYDNHHVDNDDGKPSALPKRGYSYSSKSDEGECIHHPDKSDTVFATFSTPVAKRGKRTPK
jgi:hypothetical protein